MTASAHPAPSTMAREAYPNNARDTKEERNATADTRADFAAGVAEERARVAADMRGRSRIRASEAEAFAAEGLGDGAELRGAGIELAEYADELEGKVQP